MEMCSKALHLQEILGEENIWLQEPMKKHTTFRTGGNADVFVTPKDVESLAETLRYCREHELPVTVVGNGSNLLVADAGIRGVVVQIGEKMSGITHDGHTITAKAGTMLSALSKKALELSLTGLEFASGIPGTVGGAVVMNAGAYGGEIQDTLVSVGVLTKDLTVLEIPCEQLELSYRHSIIPTEEYIVLWAKFSLVEGNKEEMKTRMQEFAQARQEKQPLQFPSAGSTFKRPEGYFAGRLIEDAGLKGKTIGGAQVSLKHAGFIINIGDATTKDILDLIAYCQKEVQEKFGVQIETEVKYIGE